MQSYSEWIGWSPPPCVGTANGLECSRAADWMETPHPIQSCSEWIGCSRAANGLDGDPPPAWVLIRASAYARVCILWLWLGGREVGPLDVEIDIKLCGICHSDLHQIKNEWNGSSYPMVPG